MRQLSIDNSALQKSIGQEVTLIAQLRTDPAQMANKVIGNRQQGDRYSFRASTMYGPIRVIASPDVKWLLPGQKIQITGKVLKTDESRVAALFITSGKVEVVTGPSRWARTLAAIRNGLRDASGGGDVGALIPGMVIGDTAKQSADFKNDMRRAGLTHLVAVSGANFAIVSAFVLWCMQFLFSKINHRIWATAIALAAFIALVRPSPSVLRAAAMAAVALLAMHTYQRGDSLPALGFAIAAVISIDPWQARDPGFALSVLATLGLLLFSPKIATRLNRYMPEKVAAACAPPIAALILCLPVIVCLSGYISLSSLIANIVAAPFVAPITVVGFVAALISPISPLAAHLLLIPIKPCAWVITAIARWAARMPVITLREGRWGFLAALGVIILIAVFRKRAIVLLLAVTLALLWWTRFPAMDWQIVSCDVGQGDATVINLHRHRAIVIDVGPDPVLIDSCLRNLHITTISLLILTHPHADHIGGLTGARKGRTIEHQWFENVAAGTTAHIGEYSIKVLWPLTIGAQDENPNNISIAAVITSRDLTLFAAGDIEPDVQSQLYGKVGHVDIYKVAHHGSRYQDSQLMSEIDPTLALISVGKGNTYGHPDASTISSLESLGARVLRTDRDGAIAVEVKSHRIRTRTRGSRLQWFGLG